MDYSMDSRTVRIETSRLNCSKQRAVKRLGDVLVSAAGLIVLMPLLAIIAIAVKLDSPGPVIFRHKRVGKDGASFDMHKFRSMISGGDDTEYMRYLAELIESDRNCVKNGLPYRKMDGDPRVTRVGRVLRKYYLDELPQLWNVLRGDMSLVGPRPHVQFEVDHYRPHQRQRLSLRPGCTGLWQVEGKVDCSFDQLIDLDMEYIERWCLLLDLQILSKTAALMIPGGGSVWARTAKYVPGPRIRSNGNGG